MTKHIYANLAPMGWTDLSSDPDTIMGENHSDPNTWWEENASIYAPFKRTEENTAYQLPYINVGYKGNDYRISPYHLQIVTTD